jgi:predicted 2-oxoglutarate/Fe(II)-dependent dioxygenase YbiX
MSSPQRTEILGDRIQTIRGLFSPGECDALVRMAEGIGFDAAPVTTSVGFVMMPELRNNTRVILDDTARAAALWQRLAPWVPEARDRFRAVGLNERFRFYRYARGQYFRWHRDGAFVRDAREQSFVTALVYLNDDFEGGSTDFDLGDEEVRVVPERGLVLLFDHRFRHQGAPIGRGRKYVLRTDVMYRRGDA